jgi:hypothetical protein
MVEMIPTTLVNETVTHANGSFTITHTCVNIKALKGDTAKTAIKTSQKKPAQGNTNVKANVPTKNYYRTTYTHTEDGREREMMIRMKNERSDDKKTILGIRQIDSYPPEETDATKQQHSIKVTFAKEEDSEIAKGYFDELNKMHDGIVRFVFENQLAVLGNKQNKKIEIIQELCKNPVKVDIDDEGNPYPPKMRIKIKLDQAGKPRAEVYRKEDNQVKPVDVETIDEFKEVFNSSYDKVITVKPTFYVMGSQCGWSLSLHSILLGEKVERQVQERPAYTADDLNDVSTNVAEIEINEDNDADIEDEVETEENTTTVPETAVIASSDDEENNEDDEEEVVEDDEELDLPPPPTVTSKPRATTSAAPIAAPKARGRAAARK